MTGTPASRRRAPEYRRLRRSELWLLLIPVAVGIAVPIIWQAPLGLTLLALLLAAATGFGSSFLSGIPRLVVSVVVGLGAAFAWGRVEPALAIGWLMLFPCASALGWHVRAVLAGTPEGSRRTKDRSVPDPAAGPRLTYDSADDWVQVAEPTPDEVAAAVEELDGEHRTVVSVLRGSARLDIGGDAGGPMMAYHCDDSTASPARWSHLTTPDATDAQVAVRLAGDVGHFRRRQTTTIEPARQAVAEFLRSGGRAAGLPWHSDGEVAGLRPPALDED